MFKENRYGGIKLREKTVYKRSIITMIVGMIAAPVTGVIIWFLCGLFFDETGVIGAIAGGLITLITWYISIFSERVRIEIDKMHLSYFKGKKLVHRYKLDQITIGYREKYTVGGFGSDTLDLKIYNVETRESDSIDCAPLGSSRFYKMYNQLSECTVIVENVLKVTKEGKFE